MNNIIQLIIDNWIWVIVVIFNSLLIFILINLFRKVSLLKNAIITSYNHTIDLFRNIEQIDESGMFEVDDDVGEIFKRIKKLIEVYHKLINDSYFNM